MSATRHQGLVNAEASRFLFELEQEFDLMRLKVRRASLEQEDMHLAEEQESLRNDLRPPVAFPIGPSAAPAGNGRIRWWWRAAATRVAIWQLGIRREGLAEELRRLALLEGDIEFARRLRKR
jgi:hypothetical protein